MTIQQIKNYNDYKSLFVELLNDEQRDFVVRPCFASREQIINLSTVYGIQLGQPLFSSVELNFNTENIYEFALMFEIMFGKSIDFVISQKFKNSNIIYQRVLDAKDNFNEIWLYSIG